MGISTVTDEKTKLDIETQLFATAIGAPIVKLYVNGFILGHSMSDVTIVCQTNGTPSAVLNMSFTIAKSLAIEMDKIIKNFEKITDHTLLTIDDIKTKMSN